MGQEKSIFSGIFIHCPSFGIFEIFKAEIICNNGVITQVNNKILIEEFDSIEEFYIPGFIDAHLHAPQFKNLALGLDKPLLEWLNATTFPIESKFTSNDEPFYKRVVNELTKRGTTTACYFGTIQNEANKSLVNAIEFVGQRAFVGKVCMDSNSPDYYTEDTLDSIESTKEFIKNFEIDQLTKPIITPRFAISCSMVLMKELGCIAHQHNLPIQTHISENENEIAFVKQLFPSSKDYMEVYEEANLITDRTILAHGIHLSRDELRRIKERNCALVHCPNSNFNLNSGVARIRDWLDMGVKVALGTDVSGGSSMSMLNAIQYTVMASKAINLLADRNYKPLSIIEAFYLATAGGGEALNLKLGKFEVGYSFDALLISYKDNINQPRNISNKFHSFLYNGDDRHIKRVFINSSPIELS